MAAATTAAATLLVERPDVSVTLTESRGQRILWRRAVAPGALIELHYRHSVERTPVVEEFRAARDGLRLVAMRFSSQGAGLPTQGYTLEGGQFVLRTDRRLAALPMRVSGIAGHRLRIASEDLDLVHLAGEGAAVTLTSGPGPWRLRWPREEARR